MERSVGFRPICLTNCLLTLIYLMGYELCNLSHNTFELQEVPAEEVLIQEDDKFIQVYHFQKEPLRGHGIPFKFLLKKVGRGTFVHFIS